jgi:hypothetical protein
MDPIRPRVGALFALISLCAAAPAAAQEGFESFSEGTVIVTQVPGAAFADPVEVFRPTRVRTGGAHAVRGCAGCTQVRILFNPTAGSVRLAVGMDAAACDNDSCFDTAVRLQGFDASGRLIMSTPPLSLSDLSDITRVLEVTDPGAGIASVSVVYTNLGRADQGRVSLDDLAFSTAAGVAPPPAGPPVVTFREPGDNAVVLSAPLIRGHVDAPAGVLALCAAANAMPDPAACETRNLVTPGTTSSDFSLGPMRALHAGPNTVNVLVRDNRGREAAATLSLRLVDASTGADFEGFNLMITQGVQQTPPAGSGAVRVGDASEGPRAAYAGTALARGARTAVRFFADVRSRGAIPLGVPLRPPARLFGFVDAGHAGGGLGPDRGEVLGAPLPGSPLSPDASAAPLPGTSPLAAQVADPTGGYQFTLPDSWTRAGTIILQAEVNPPGVPGALPEGDHFNNGFQVERIGFVDPHPPIRIDAVALTYRNAPGGFGSFATVPDPWMAYDRLRRLLPMRIDVPGYRTIVDISNIVTPGSSFDMQSGRILSLLGSYNDVGTSNRYVVGFTETDRQASISPQALGQGFLWGHGVAYVAPSRPLTSVGHETLHLLGFSHAGSECGAREPDSGGFETWPAGDDGAILGTGLDVNGAPAPRTGRYAVIDAGVGGVAAWADFMSYCATSDEANAWISTRNWNRLLGGPDISSPRAAAAGVGPRLAWSGALSAALDLLAPSPARRGAAPAPGRADTQEPTLRVYAWALQGRGEIWRVAGGTRHLTQPDPASPYRIVVRDAGGTVVSDTRVRAAEVRLHHTAREAFFAAEVPARGAARVQLVVDGPCPAPAAGPVGCVLAERRQGPSAPTVTLRQPEPGAVVGPGPLVVSWTSSTGGGAGSFADVDYSPDDGRSWRPVAANLSGERAELPAFLFSRSGSARVRVTVNDGFSETSAVSPPFVAPGSGPTVHIGTPDTVAIAGVPVTLSGDAFDDTGERIAAEGLRWLDGGRPLASGDAPGSVVLSPGLHRITLVATDAAGRSGEARRVVRVRARDTGRRRFRCLELGLSVAAAFIGATMLAGLVHD